MYTDAEGLLNFDVGTLQNIEILKSLKRNVRELCIINGLKNSFAIVHLHRIGDGLGLRSMGMVSFFQEILWIPSSISSMKACHFGIREASLIQRPCVYTFSAMKISCGPS